MTSEQTLHNEHKNYYETLHQAAMIISSSIELPQVLQDIVKTIAESMEVKASALRLLDSATGQLELSAAYGLSASYLHKGPVNSQLSVIDQETLCCSPVFIPDVRVDTRFQYRNEAALEGLVSVLSIPLEVHGTAIGVLRVYTDTPTVFTEEDVQFLSVLASLAAQAIENARLYDSLKSSYAGVVGAFMGTPIL